MFWFSSLPVFCLLLAFVVLALIFLLLRSDSHLSSIKCSFIGNINPPIYRGIVSFSSLGLVLDKALSHFLDVDDAAGDAACIAGAVVDVSFAVIGLAWSGWCAWIPPWLFFLIIFFSWETPHSWPSHCGCDSIAWEETSIGNEVMVALVVKFVSAFVSSAHWSSAHCSSFGLEFIEDGMKRDRKRCLESEFRDAYVRDERRKRIKEYNNWSQRDVDGFTTRTDENWWCCGDGTVTKNNFTVQVTSTSLSERRTYSFILLNLNLKGITSWQTWWRTIGNSTRNRRKGLR